MNVPSLKDYLRDETGSPSQVGAEAPFLTNGLFAERTFDRMLYLERKRTERSQKAFFLMLLNMEDLLPLFGPYELSRRVENALSSCIRETDIRGWHEQGKVIGIIFTEMNSVDEIVKEKILIKIQDRLGEELGPEAVSKIRVCYHVFPETYNGDSKGLDWFNRSLYPEMAKKPQGKRVPLVVKRVVDCLGSLLALIVLSPVFFLIALAIRLTSKGPVLFKQQRMGQGGKTFTFLKFRSMYVNSDESSHKEFVTKLIKEKMGSEGGGAKGGRVVYKMTEDRRITPVGRFLRMTSLDELPQFINVFAGQMSLVGPRPPIPYECEIYDIWHRNRLLEVKPGITGLWQVEGRSQRTFDEMVRLDLKYINEWSLWLDLKILAKTPWVMVSRNGGY